MQAVRPRVPPAPVLCYRGLLDHQVRCGGCDGATDAVDAEESRPVGVATAADGCLRDPYARANGHHGKAAGPPRDLDLALRGRNAEAGPVATHRLTSSSPGPATPPRRAAMFTVSPSAVRSVFSSPPTTTTKASPVWTPAPTISPFATRPSRSTAARIARPAAMARSAWLSAGDDGDEQRHDAVTQELVDDAAIHIEGDRGRPVVALDQASERRCSPRCVVARSDPAARCWCPRSDRSGTSR